MTRTLTQQPAVRIVPASSNPDGAGAQLRDQSRLEAELFLIDNISPRGNGVELQRRLGGSGAELQLGDWNLPGGNGAELQLSDQSRPGGSRAELQMGDQSRPGGSRAELQLGDQSRPGGSRAELHLGDQSRPGGSRAELQLADQSRPGGSHVTTPVQGNCLSRKKLKLLQFLFLLLYLPVYNNYIQNLSRIRSWTQFF